MKPRKITNDYLQLFVETIKRGAPVTFVEQSNLLAVDHPEKGYLVLQIADEVGPREEKENVRGD